MKVGIVTQARMTSTRLPAKVLKVVKGRTLLDYHLERLRWSGAQVIVATTTNSTDDVLIEFCQKNDVPFHRGSESNVLERYYQTAEKFKLDVIVRVTSDCPLNDGRLIAQGIERFLQSKDTSHLYLCNTQKRTFPRGFDFEIFSLTALRECYQKATLEYEREHVTPYIWKSHPEKFAIEHFVRDADDSKFRITVDEADDFRIVQELIEKYSAEKLSCEEIIQVLRANPYLYEMNAHVEQKKV